MDETKENVPNVHTDVCHDVEEKREERRMRHWVIRRLVQVGCFVTVVVVLSMMYGYVVQGRDMESEATTGIMDNIFTVIKFIFN